MEPGFREAPTTATAFGLKNGRIDAEVKSRSLNSETETLDSVAATLKAISSNPPSIRSLTSNPECRKTSIIFLLSICVTARNLTNPLRTAMTDNRSNSCDPTPFPWSASSTANATSAVSLPREIYDPAATICSFRPRLRVTTSVRAFEGSEESLNTSINCCDGGETERKRC